MHEKSRHKRSFEASYQKRDNYGPTNRQMEIRHSHRENRQARQRDKNTDINFDVMFDFVLRQAAHSVGSPAKTIAPPPIIKVSTTPEKGKSRPNPQNASKDPQPPRVP